MVTTNLTQVRMFVFSGLTDNGELAPFLFILFLHVYMVTVVGNIGMMAIVHNNSNLHTPMYFFLSYLSLVDLFYSSVITPKMLSDLISTRKTISFVGCALQFFLFAGLACTEVLLLSNMAYDRYAAICHPLHYVSIMTKNICMCLVVLAFSIGFLQSSFQTICVYSLHFCDTILIDHFYCDVPPLLKLSCSDTFSCVLVTVFFVASCGMGSFIVILISYMFIISSILRMKSAEGRRKAFSTCSSHLTCSSIFYVSVFFTYLRSPSNAIENQDKIAAVFYSAVTPMLNPLIYSLRNQEVKRVIIQAMHNITDVDIILSFIRDKVGVLSVTFKLHKTYM
ncbi:olfactory receptor 5B21-like [Pseudophryne corroboree]|uniref:olfactory receptor 5B21-like n=1 Tax=Pseudophryne corroboree TaxID=495146 RepID=UPI0030818B5F